MSSLALVLALVLAAGVALVALLLLSRSHGTGTATAARLAEVARSQAMLEGRLDQLGSSVERGLAATTRQLASGISEHADRTGETLGELERRLILLGEAQRRFEELSGELSMDIGG